MAMVKCDWCGKEHYRRPSHTYEHNFCSKPCFKAWIQRDKPRLVCEWCGKEFLVPPIREDSAKFCSQECYHEWNRKTQAQVTSVQVNCAWCGAELLRIPARIKRSEHHFCDTTCAGKWRAENITGEQHPSYALQEVKCAYCGETLLRPPSIIHAYEHVFCGRECKAAWQSGENSPFWKGGTWDYNYGLNWKRQKQRARKRDGYKCLWCGVVQEDCQRELDVHHYAPFREFGLGRYKEANRLKNLGTFCRTCHKIVEPLGKDWR